MPVAVPKKSRPFDPSYFNPIVCSSLSDEGAEKVGALLPVATGEIVSESSVWFGVRL